jgi:hypothetical protein
MVAIKNKNWKIVPLMLENEVDIHAKNKEGKTALIMIEEAISQTTSTHNDSDYNSDDGYDSGYGSDYDSKIDDRKDQLMKIADLVRSYDEKKAK